MIAYYGSKLSPHMTETPEGFLICHDVKIARTGTQNYLAREIGLDGMPERVLQVTRSAEDVFDPAAIASFEGKDVTNTHPSEMIVQEINPPTPKDTQKMCAEWVIIWWLTCT